MKSLKDWTLDEVRKECARHTVCKECPRKLYAWCSYNIPEGMPEKWEFARENEMK